jgi:hypothetical protein
VHTGKRREKTAFKGQPFGILSWQLMSFCIFICELVQLFFNAENDRRFGFAAQL